ncbi:MAG: hypothetical protein IJ171_00490 [Ruminococcus sp.]|nr:hypothetical protein [Ruminococcus sp.]
MIKEEEIMKKCSDRSDNNAVRLSSNPPLPKATPAASLLLASIGVICDIICLFLYFSINRLTISTIFAVSGTLTGLTALILIIRFIENYRLSSQGIFALVLSIISFGFGVLLLITDILISTNIYEFLTALLNNINL